MATPTRWDDGQFTAHLELLVWTASPVVKRYLHALVSGDPNCDWLTWVEAAHLRPGLDRALVLGCGSGWLERALAQRGRFRSIVACDFAPETVNRAPYGEGWMLKLKLADAASAGALLDAGAYAKLAG